MNCQDGVCGCDGPGDKKGSCLLYLLDGGVGVGFFLFGRRLLVCVPGVHVSGSLF